MGFSIPAALGVHVAAPEKRAVVIVGDGAFQMTGMELSSVVRHGYAPVIFVLDNQGYGTERFLHAGHWDYNEIHPWNYHRLPDLLGGGTGYEVCNEAELVHAVDQAWADTSGFSLIHIHINRDDYSVTLGRLVERLSQRV
jgi:indolepyruvate decarboxylase